MTTEIIIYSCLSFVSLSLAIGYLLKIYVPVISLNTNTIPYVEKHSVELVATDAIATL